MAIGTYGNRRPADVNPIDIEVLVVFSSDRNLNTDQTITKYNGVDVIKPVFHTEDTGGQTVEILGGLYNLELPTEAVGEKGFYTVYVRPVQIRAQIEDCGDLSNYPDVKGLVFNVDSTPSEYQNKFVNNGLDGYRVEYLNRNGTKIPNLHRVITSSFLVEPIMDNSSNTSQKTVKYVYNNSGSLLYCTMTPNAAPSFNPTASPFLGLKGQDVIITNTYFNPIQLDIEMVDYDVDSLAIALYGEQTKSIDDGIYTIYDFNGNIYKQYDLYEVKDTLENPLYEVRRLRSEIDRDKERNNIIDG